jgi:hypothetical protein
MISHENGYDAKGPQAYRMKIQRGIFILNRFISGIDYGD